MERTPIGKLAREASVAGSVPTEIDSNKERLYIALSILTDNLVQWVLDQRKSHPPYGLVEMTEVASSLFNQPDQADFSHAIDPFKLLGVLLRKTFQFHIGDYFDDPKTQGDIYNTARDCLIARDDQSNPYKFISGGINTASDFMCGSLRAIHQLTPDKTAEEKLEIARHSYITLKEIASIDLLAFRNYNEVFISGQPDVLKGDRVELVQKPFGLNLSIKSSQKESPVLIEDLRELGHRVGCPASVNLSSGSAMRKLYYWMLEVVDAGGLFKTRPVEV